MSKPVFDNTHPLYELFMQLAVTGFDTPSELAAAQNAIIHAQLNTEFEMKPFMDEVEKRWINEGNEPVASVDLRLDDCRVLLALLLQEMRRNGINDATPIENAVLARLCYLLRKLMAAEQILSTEPDTKTRQ